MRRRAFTNRRSIAGRALALALAAMVSAGGVAAHDGRPHATAPAEADSGVPATPFPVKLGGPFALTDHAGRPRTDGDFRGRYLLVFFGYASCAGMCPLALAHMAGALDLLGPAGERVQPLFISVDPARDTPARLAGFVAKLHPRLVGLTGTPAQTAAAAKAYNVESRPVARAGDGGAILAHGTFVYLMGPDGRLLTLMPPVMDAETMAATIRRYLS
jgi:protein SCO1/2